jgi:glycogen(starch) synthase
MLNISRSDLIARDGLRLLYLSGPGDAPSVVRAMAEGHSYEGVAHVAYSGQVFNVCRELGAHVLSVSSHPRTDDFSFGSIRAINRPTHLENRGGLGYHAANIPFAFDVMKDVREFRANVVLTATEPYPFLLEPLAWLGVKLIPALHAALLPAFRKSPPARRLAVRQSRRFYAKSCYAILSHPGVAVDQVNTLTDGQHRPIVEFLPLFRRETFADVPGPARQRDVFKVMTVGRVEPEKGIFSLIEIARRVREAGGNNVRFDVCGEGSALAEARRRVTAQGLDDVVRLHGWTSMEDLHRLWGESHVALVPTTSDFVEGFNQVVIEALLVGRPVITSRVCPALDFVRPSAIEVEVDDVSGYAHAILELAQKPESYDRLQSRCAELMRPFLDQSKSFGAAVHHVLKSALEGREVSPVAHPPQYNGAPRAQAAAHAIP